MSLHLRYTDATQSEHRRQVKFLRLDLIWQTEKLLISPYTGLQLNGLPIWKDKSMVIGPTILDMMTRTVWPTKALPEEKRSLVPAGQAGIAVWGFRDLATIWRKPDEAKRPAKEIADLEREHLVDHPFKVSMASGGQVTSLGEDFLTVKKNSTVSLSEIAFKLAIGMYGGFESAYTQIGKMAAAEWEADLERAQALWRHIQQANGFLLEDSAIAALRPLSSVSQEVERLVLRQACSWLGVDPDIEYRRPPGRPQSEAGDEGQIIRVTINDANEMTGEMKKEFFGVPAGTDLSVLGLRRLIELLGALRTEEYEIDADFLEAYLAGC